MTISAQPVSRRADIVKGQSNHGVHFNGPLVVHLLLARVATPENGAWRQGMARKLKKPMASEPLSQEVEHTPFAMPVSDRRVLKYQSIAVDIRDRIARGALRPGQQLPASASLAKQYGVALMTVRQALALLEHEGTIEARHGAGTFVVDGPRRNQKRFGKILLVEDEEALCETVAAALRDYGHTVDTSLNGRDALTRLRSREPYDAIVLDLRLPDMNGLEIVEYLKSSRPSLGLIVASGYLEQEDVLRTAERWPIMMLRKPYAASDLIERLAMLLQQRREYARV